MENNNEGNERLPAANIAAGSIEQKKREKKRNENMDLLRTILVALVL